MDEDIVQEERPGFRGDRRAELMLDALVCGVVLMLLAMLIFVLKQAWPSFAHNGLGWFGPGGSVDDQIQAIFTSGELKQAAQYTIHAWPLLWSTILTTVGAVGISFVCALFVSVFLVEFAPAPVQRVLEPVVRLLASVPSVIYGLIAVLVVVPFIGNHLISDGSKAGSGASRRCRAHARWFARPCPPNRTCPFLSIRLSTGHVLAVRVAGLRIDGFRWGGGPSCSGVRCPR